MTDSTDTKTSDAAEKDKLDKRQRERVERLLARPAVLSSGAVTLANGQHLDYSVRASFVAVVASGLGDDAGEPQAAVFTIAYTTAGLQPGAPRPICFAFNGGPGSASVWLHLGALGPKRVLMPDDGGMPAPPYAVVDNPHSWLGHFDLVFIDPPHTGFSLSASAKARKSHLSVDGDIAAMAEVVRAWLAANGRFGSPAMYSGEPKRPLAASQARTTSAMAAMSPSTDRCDLRALALAESEKPVCGGSMKTRSKWPSQLCGLSTTA